MQASRGVAIFLSACLLLSASGCLPAEHWAEKARGRVALEMTFQEVTDQLGEPDQIVRGEPGQPQYWLYRFESEPSAIAIVLLALLVVGFIVVLALAKGGSGGGLGGGGGGSCDEDQAQFKVHFDGEGRVNEISPIVVGRTK